jgi:predicted secreted hydrolase
VRRRRAVSGLLALGAAGWLPGLRAAQGPAASAKNMVPAKPAAPDYPAVTPGVRLVFPRDHGAHPAFRTEWWYATGWLQGARGEAIGFQVTFFRSRPPFKSDNPSVFAPTQLYLAHAALADARHGRLRHDQRAARAALGLAGAAEGRTEVWVDDWTLSLEQGVYRTRVAARGFSFALEMQAGRAPLLQGEDGYSRKGARPAQASYYYSRPGMAVQGRIERGGVAEAVSGTAWLDHEWSSTLMAPEAAGWDWIGVSLDDGGALMAFRMRDREGGTLYAGGTWMQADGRSTSFGPGEVDFQPQRRWRSPRSATEYPVVLEVRTGGRRWRIEPLMDDQELDSRASTGTIYWEGAVRAQCIAGGEGSGRGYLELTGYWRPLRL